MRTTLTHALRRYQATFATFSTGQKMVTLVGTAALVLAAFLVFRWAATPNYAPLFTNLASEDAAAVIEQLDADGVPYELTSGGSTISVPRSEVYSTRISLSGEGLPANSGEGGYALLDSQDISTSQFQEQTDFKRAMEGELATTIEALDGVTTAVVHLALPQQKVFAREQESATASVLVDTQAGSDLGSEQVQAVVHLVASSIEGLDPSDVTVADAGGRVLSADDGSGGLASTRAQQVNDYQDELDSKIQSMLDQVLGAGNSTVQVTAQLDFDKSVTESTTYTRSRGAPPLSETSQDETYAGGDAAGVGGVVGADGQMDPGAGGQDGSYRNQSATRDNAVDRVVEQRETAPGRVESLHTAVVYDVNAPVKVDTAEVEDLVAAAIGIDEDRGDTIQVSAVPFDTSAAEANAAALAEAEAADDAARREVWLRNGSLGSLVLLMLLLAWLRARKQAKARQQATTYVVEQLRNDAAERAALSSAPPRLEPNPATLALERSESPDAAMRDELTELVERQPEEVAALLRGWLGEQPR